MNYMEWMITVSFIFNILIIIFLIYKFLWGYNFEICWNNEDTYFELWQVHYKTEQSSCKSLIFKIRKRK